MDPEDQEIKVEKPELVITKEEHTSPEVEVDLNKQPQTKVDGATDSTEKLRNQMFYEMRQQEKKILAQQQRMMDELVSRISGTNSKPQGGASKLDDFDEEVERVAQTDWRKAVDMRAERIAQKLYEEKVKAKEELDKQESQRQSAMRIEAKGREKVLAEFPDIMDESTPEFRAYMEVYNREVNDDPLFMYNPRKHEIILPELREKMGGSKRREATNPEIERLTRVAAGVQTPSRQNTTSNKIMLTQDEVEMCKRSGISVEAYARTKKLGNAGLKEGIVMDD